MRIAVVGSGITGLSCAWILSNNSEHSVSLYEAADYLGGHTNTVDIHEDETKRNISVDTGFIVYNEPNYPNLTEMFKELGVETEDSDMSFALSLNNGMYEWAGDSLSTVFAQWKNLFSPSHWRMLLDILKFDNEAPKILGKPEYADLTMGEYLDQHGYSQSFIENYLFPITSAIWSLPLDGALNFPAQSLIQFFHNHQLLQIFNRPQWRTVSGGSREYVKKIRERLEANGCQIHVSTPVRSVTRKEENGKWIVNLQTDSSSESFDQIVLACHADTSLKLLQDPSEYERRVLSTFQYSKNVAVLHSDESFMPRRRNTWSSWNYLRNSKDNRLVLSYWMNRLQPFVGTVPTLLVTLNPPEEISPSKVYKTIAYEHPIYVPKSVSAQGEIVATNGHRGTHFAGAYLGWGFHEDGLLAGIRTALSLQGKCPWPVDYSRYDMPKRPGETAAFGISSWADHVFLGTTVTVAVASVGYAVASQLGFL